MNRVLLTGASGFIGVHCLKLFSHLGYEVHTVSLDQPPVPTPKTNTYRHICDLDQPLQIKKLLQRIQPTHLLHLAWHVEPGMRLDSPKNFQCVKAGLELLQYFAEVGGRRAVFAGSCAEYDWRYGYLSEKLTPLRSDHAYGTCKNALQLLMKDFCRIHKISWGWARIFFTFGPNEKPERLVPYVINSMLQGQYAECTHGFQIRDYLYVKDVADALVALLMSDVQGPINIASGFPLQQKKLIKKILQEFSMDIEMIRFGARPVDQNEPPYIVGDNERLKTELKWQPKTDLDEGLRQTILWWKEKRNQSNREIING